MDKGGSAVVMTSYTASKIPASLDGLNESQLRVLLETTFNFEERLAIRRAIRQQRKKTAESPEASRTTTGKTASYLQKDSSGWRTNLSKSNGEVKDKSNRISPRKAVPSSNGHNLKEKATLASHRTDKSETRDVQTAHGSRKASMDSDSIVGKTEQSICERVGLESGKLDQKRASKKEENGPDVEMDEVESKNLKNISLNRDTVSSDKGLKEIVREIENEDDNGTREKGKAKLDLVEDDKELKNKNITSVDEMGDGSGCEMKRERCDEETSKKDDGNETEREAEKCGVDFEADVELPHRLVEVHINDDNEGEGDKEGDSLEMLSSHREPHQINDAVSEVKETKEIDSEETANMKEENIAGDVALAHDCSLEKEKIGLSDSEKIEEIVSHRIGSEDSHVKCETDESLKVDGVVEVVDHQLVGSREDDEVAERDCNSNEKGAREKDVREKDEVMRNCVMELGEFQRENAVTSELCKQKDLSGLNLEVSLEEKGKICDLEVTKEKISGISSESGEGFVGKSERVNDNIVIDTELSDETTSHENRQEPQKVCDSKEKIINSIDMGGKDEDRATSSGGQGEPQGTFESEEGSKFIDNEIKGEIGTNFLGKEKDLQGTSERSENSWSIETDSKRKDGSTLSLTGEGPFTEMSKSCAKTVFSDTENEGKEKTASSETDEHHRATESRDKSRSVETEIDGKQTSLSEKEEASEEQEKQELKLEDISDETVLRKMLDSSFDFEERRKIRAAIRALKKKQQNQHTPEKKVVQQSYLNLQNQSWKSGRNTPVLKTNTSPRTVTNSQTKPGLGKQNSLEKELPQCKVKSNFAKPDAELVIDNKSCASNKRESLSVKKDNQLSAERLSLEETVVSSLPERYQPSKSSPSSSTRWSSGITASEKEREAGKVESTLEVERDHARQRRREWQRSLLRSYEEPETPEDASEADVRGGDKGREEGTRKGNDHLESNGTRNATEVNPEDAFSKREVADVQSQDDESASLKSENSFHTDDSSIKKSSSVESSDQSLETSQEGPSQETAETADSEGALPVTTQVDTEIYKDASLSKVGQASKEKCAIKSKGEEFNREKGSRRSVDLVKKLGETKEDSLSSKSSSSFEMESETEDTPKHSKRSNIIDVTVEINQDNLKGQKDVGNDEKNKGTITESQRINEKKMSSLKNENLDKMKEERSTFLSSRWREPKKANFTDLRKQFQGGFEKQREEKKEDKALKGVKGKVSQAALLFNSPSTPSPSRQRLSSEPTTPKRWSSSTPRRTIDRGITDQKLAGNSSRRFSSEFSLSDRSKNKAETKSSHQAVSIKDEETSLNKGLEESPSTSIYVTPVGTPGSPDIFYTPKEAMDGTPANLSDKTPVSKASEVEELSLLHSKRTTAVEGDQHRKKVKVEAGKLSPEETHQAEETETDTTTMAPTVEQITDETTLEKMLEEATIFEDRKKIRARLRELRKQKRGGGDSIGPASQDPTPDLNMDTGDDATTVTTERKRTRASALTVNTTQQSTENKEVKPVGTTALSPVSPAAKTVRTDSNLANDHSKTVVERDDGKTKTMTMTSVKTAPGAKSMQVTTMSKTDDGSGTKSASVKQETTTTKVETSADGTKSSFSKTTTSTFSSSSSSTSSTDKPATGKPQSKFQLELEEKKKKRAEQQKIDEAKWKADQDARRKAAYERKKREEAEAAKKKASLMDKFGGKATSVGPSGPKKTVAGGSTRMMAQNPATIKAKLLEWAQRCTRGYANCKIENFSGSWCDGMAFCAVVHSYFPDAFDYNSLDPKNRRYNFDLAFNTAEKCADIYPLLETDDMIMMKNKPDWKCVFTYVQALYRGLHKAAGQVPS